MDKEVVWTLLATVDLESIVEYILRDSESYAAAVARELMAAGRSLATLSERRRIVTEYEDPAVRELIVRRYRLIYRVRSDRVEVLRIIHGSPAPYDRLKTPVKSRETQKSFAGTAGRFRNKTPAIFSIRSNSVSGVPLVKNLPGANCHA
jgi:toxin ParE1/3/4